MIQFGVVPKNRDIEYVYIGALRIPKYLHCKAVYGHQLKEVPDAVPVELAGTPVMMTLRYCELCGLQRYYPRGDAYGNEQKVTPANCDYFGAVAPPHRHWLTSDED